MATRKRATPKPPVSISPVEIEPPAEAPASRDFAIVRTMDGRAIALNRAHVIFFRSDDDKTTLVVTTDGSQHEVALRLRAFARKLGAL